MTTQKQYMVAAVECTRSKERAIEVYAALDSAGVAPRESNVTPRDSRDYATILWHTGRRNGWF